MRYYSSGGAYWLGMRSLNAGGSIEPLVGPLADSAAGHRGVTLTYLDANDASATTPEAVRAIAIALRGVTDERVYRAGGTVGAIDTVSMTARVALRNALRP